VLAGYQTGEKVGGRRLEDGGVGNRRSALRRKINENGAGQKRARRSEILDLRTLYKARTLDATRSKP